MVSVAKFFAFILALVLVLSININNKPIFAHIYKVISPATESAQKSVQGFFSSSFSKTQKVSKQLFDNSVPAVKDKISSKQSALIGKPLEKIEKEEREQLDELIKDHSKR